MARAYVVSWWDEADDDDRARGRRSKRQPIRATWPPRVRTTRPAVLLPRDLSHWYHYTDRKKFRWIAYSWSLKAKKSAIYLTDVDPDLSDPLNIAFQLFTGRDAAATEFVVRFDRTIVLPFAASFGRSGPQEWTLRQRVLPLPPDAESRGSRPVGAWAVGQSASIALT
jgi:hypothetical protein